MQNTKYRSLYSEESRDEDPDDTHCGRIRFKGIKICFSIFGLCNFILGFMIGRWSSTLSIFADIDSYPKPYGNTIQIWQKNDTFASIPTPESEAAWESIIPKGRGFIMHPSLAPEGKSIAVFHELHCLHTIQIGYYYALYNLSLHTEATSELSGNPVHPGDTFIPTLKVKTNSEHIQHCFDYLRQALMCAADTNLEVANKTTGVTNGWGSARTCRDYGEVLRWAEEWRVSDETTILGLEKQAEGHP